MNIMRRVILDFSTTDDQGFNATLRLQCFDERSYWMALIECVDKFVELLIVRRHLYFSM
jgi:hypothetical protein